MKNLLLLLPLLSTASLFAQNGGGAREGNFMQTIIMIAIAIVFFYFILWRPERKRRKEMEAKRGSMKKGDRVTAMGIVGKVEEIKDTTVVLSSVDGSKIEVLKMAISEVQGSDQPAPEKK
ncbi:MAG: preprotein translocase subunit YajC [Simkaniaceae bacterium]|nr:preprotein translocase subunit YajC [Candidatus Sacchlamyda saccharinae]